MRNVGSSNRQFIRITLLLGVFLFMGLGMLLFFLLRYGASPLLEPADPEGLTRHVFALAGNDFEVLMPPEYTLTVDHDAQVSLAIPGQRVDRSMILSAAAPAMRFAEGDRSIHLEGGYRLRYVEVPDLGAGSGGTVSEMIGQIGVGSMLLTVECRDQAELEPDPKWCIPYLHHLRAVE